MRKYVNAFWHVNAIINYAWPEQERYMRNVGILIAP